ncbi:MAG: cupredoxin domain-containing protein [Actinomycetota bacterium]
MLFGRIGVAVAVAMTCGVACAEGDEGSGRLSAGSMRGTEVVIDGIAYLPDRIEVTTGDEVTWMNEDDVLHTVTSGTQAEQGVPGVSKGTDAKPDGSFDARLDGANTRSSFTFDEPGTYEYYCSVHVGMVGEVVVN